MISGKPITKQTRLVSKRLGENFEEVSWSLLGAEEDSTLLFQFSYPHITGTIYMDVDNERQNVRKARIFIPELGLDKNEENDMYLMTFASMLLDEWNLQQA